MSKVVQFITHPLELKAAIQLKFFRRTNFPRNLENETKSMKRCYELLAWSSRSFAAVIYELDPELRVAIMIFYLVLRALDTIEDDMSIDPKIKIPLLRHFDEKLELLDWTFDGNAPTEKDKCVLVEFDNILVEYSKLKPQYKSIIKEITYKMGNGMADYINDEKFNLVGVATIDAYDLYCYYVAGLVGVGSTKLFVELRAANPKVSEDKYMHLTDSMGLFLRKTNIIRDFKEDLDDGRSFWPREIWSKYVLDLKDLTRPENSRKSLDCTSELVLNALEHVKDVLVYLSLVEEQSAYQFCVIPQVMAIATLELVFENPMVFQKHIKIRRGETCQLIVRSRTYKGCIEIFREYIRRIHHKCPVEDEHYLQIGIKCGELEQFIEGLFIEEYMPEGAMLPNDNEIYNDVKSKVKSDEKVQNIFEKETQTCNQVLLGLLTIVIAIIFRYSYLIMFKSDQ